MTNFNYTQFHFFDKLGNELPIVYNAACKIIIPSVDGDAAEFLAIIGSSKDIIGYHKISGGNRFSPELNDVSTNTSTGDSTATVSGYIEINGAKFNASITVGVKSYNAVSSYSSISESKSIDYIKSVDIDDSVLDFVEFPSVTFTSSIIFDRISTDLVETQSLYTLVDDGSGSYVKITESDAAKEWCNRYKILFFIDTRNDEDFRFFTLTSSDEVEWTNKIVLDNNSGDESSYRVNIGFTSNEEGIHEGKISVCIIDTESTADDGYNLVYQIGTINLQAEAVGEDERYRTLFTNFGVPDPLIYPEIFSNTDIDEDYTDNILLNQNSKRLFLAYPEIFPYIGTYKALINAVNALGYQDLFFKEWYKNIGNDTTQGKYTVYDLGYGQTTNSLDTINNMTTSERVKLKKLNWLSMIYKINEWVKTKSTDKYGFPEVSQVNGYNNSDLVVKLVSLKSWLEKYIIGLNCRIIDIGGEGIYFERYKTDSYGSYQTILEWNNEKNIAPVVTNVYDNNVLIDSSAYIYVNLGVDESNTTLEDIKTYKYSDFCDGYIDNTGIYHSMQSSTSDEGGSVFIGGSLEYLRGSDIFELKASSVTKSFLFNDDFIKISDNDIFTGSNLRVVNNEIFFNPYDLYTKHPKSAPFTKLPIIQIERANLRSTGNWNTSILYSIYPNNIKDTAGSYIIENKKTHAKQYTTDYATFIPPTYEEDVNTITITAHDGKTTVINKIIDTEVVSDFGEPVKKYDKLNYMYGLKYSSINPYNIPLFSILGYQIEHIDNNIPGDKEMYLEILDGKMLFPDSENNREIYLNFNFDNDTNEQTVTVNIVYRSDELRVTSYTDSASTFRNFIEGKNYNDFVNLYTTDIDTAVSHEFIHKIKVNNTGKFLVDVFERDMHNNIFAANCDNYGNIIMPHFDLLEYSNTKGKEDEVPITDNSELTKNFIDFCIYSPITMSTGISVKTGDELSIKYPTYSYGMHNIDKGDYVHAVDITDMYRVDAIDDIQYTLAGSELTSRSFESCNLILSPQVSRRFARILDFNDVYGASALYNNILPKYNAAAQYSDASIMVSGRATDYLKLYANSEDNFAYVNVIFYNELNSHPVYQTYGTMSSDLIYKDSPYNGKYRLAIQDYSGNSYIWADLLQCTKSALTLSLTDALNGIVSGTDAVRLAEYSLSKYLIETICDASTDTDISAGEIEDLKTVECLSKFIEDCSTYSTFIYDDCSTFKLDASIDFHMPDGGITNILYDIEACVVEDDTEIEDKLSVKLYDSLYDSGFFENLLKSDSNIMALSYQKPDGSTTALYNYMQDLSYENCGEYLKLCIDTALNTSRKCIIGESASSDNILNILCKYYADAFAIDDETSKIYETCIDNGNTIISNICSTVEFDDIIAASETDIANNFIKAIIPFAEQIESAGISYYISCLYGIMIYVSVIVLKHIVKTAEDNSKCYAEIWSDLSKHAYNRFCSTYDFTDNTDNSDDADDSDNDSVQINEIRSTAAAILGAFANIMYTQYITDIPESGVSIKAALSDKVFDTSITKDSVSIYNKLINNAAYQSYTEMSEKGWAFTKKPTYSEEIDTLSDENISSRCKFAVISKNSDTEDTAKRYVKTAEYGDDGYNEVTNDIPAAATLSILDIIDRPYISTYIKPIWRSSVNAYILDASTVENMNLDPAYDYLCVGYKKALFVNKFKIGEKVKLIFQPVGQEYYGQSTYEVVGYDVANNYIILKGSINRAYINNNEEELWGYLPVQNGYAYIPKSNADITDTFRDVTSTLKDDTEMTNKIPISETTQYITVTYEISGNTLSLTVPVKYVEDDSEDGGYWLYKLYGYTSSSSPFVISINASKIEKMNIYISYAHHGFVDYSMKSVGASENIDGITEVKIEETKKNRKLMDFIDDTFSISAKEFDIDAGVYHWMSGTKYDNTLNGGEPEISKSAVYKRRNEFTEMNSENTNIVLTSESSDGLIDNETSYKYWKIYYNNGDGNSVLLFESYNPALYLTPKEAGIYDIEATIYDRYGNESTHLYKGACVVNK